MLAVVVAKSVDRTVLESWQTPKPHNTSNKKTADSQTGTMSITQIEKYFLYLVFCEYLVAFCSLMDLSSISTLSLPVLAGVGLAPDWMTKPSKSFVPISAND